MTLLPVFTAVHEHVVLPGVGVQVAVESDPHALLPQLADQLLHVEHAGERFSHTVLVLKTTLFRTDIILDTIPNVRV